ncbi:BnaC09g32710D [Brassica napus]|uniref:BnaC09g32710D protein n=1 Tax=Brassica napus TaxID=3708 RepID=A0A078GKW4_BRANA|nr:BnaC09g32710D [Brassica napus]
MTFDWPYRGEHFNPSHDKSRRCIYLFGYNNH